MDDWKSKLSNLLSDLSDKSDKSDLSDKSDVASKKKLPRLDIILDRKRAGKTATIIAGFDDDTGIKDIAQKLKQQLGTGGSARGGEILIQGDRRADIARILSAMGYPNRLI